MSVPLHGAAPAAPAVTGRRDPSSRIDVLGPVRVHGPTVAVRVSGRIAPEILTVLVLHRGRPVDAAVLGERVWGDHPPEHVTAQLRRAVRELARTTAAVGVRIAGDGTWFRLDSPPGSTDLDLFRRSVATGRRLATRGRHDRASALLERALGLWADASVLLGPGTDAWPEAAELREERLNAVEDYAAALVAAGRPAHAVEALDRVAVDHPLRESVAVLQIRALAHGGEQARAVDVFDQMRQRLADGLGLDPGADLRRELARARRAAPPDATSA
ncbi:hypothetical protein DMP17_44430 [Pseudonocardia sp. TMWB2A]|uniref:AfsR/SARP family transcriptional regulator n=1 Tax=Pseudonocardia sp. TMWB2A TaxID=687430 RepID=UPI00307F057C